MLPRLYAIVDRGTLDARGVSVRGFAEELREGGARLVQYRDKVDSDAEVLAAAREIAAVFAGTGAVLVMNDRVGLAVELGWGVHVGQGDLGVAGVVQRLKEYERRFPSHPGSGVTSDGGRVFGVSTHTVEQVRTACEPRCPNARDLGHPDGGPDMWPDYVAVGPVFGTQTKLDAEAVVGLEGVRAARLATAKPLVAIGGIALENCRSVIEAGADSVAVISGLFVEGRRVREVARDFLERMR